MITKQILRNFQSHTHSELDYHPGVNVILGSGDVGKSAILRGITWTRTNRPLGDGFIHDDFDECNHTLYLEEDDGTKIIVRRERSRDGHNVYRLDGTEFTAFGSNPPELVSQALRLTDLNYQNQFNPYFLVTQTPGEVAQYIRELVGLDVLSSTVSNLNGRLKKCKAQRTDIDFRIETAQTSLVALENLQLGKIEALLEKAIGLQTKQVRVELKVSALIAKLSEVQKVQDQLDTIPKELPALLASTTHLSGQYTFLYDKRSSLSVILDNHRQCCDNSIDVEAFKLAQTHATKQIQLYASGQQIRSEVLPLVKQWGRLIAAEEGIATTIQLVKLVPQLIEKYRATKLHYQIVTIEEKIHSANQEIVVEEQEKVFLEAQLVACPKCGQDLSKTGKDYLLDRSCHGD